ncbi:hypothetical protein OSB04_007226 [Centaurea solstitialis]|uniref:CCHC-type domain-containing protein n=1 Tax=Centaurea solstitialis TaxID=347529 RepID=A0AA38TXA5_9ASTR|nr:hypothetical protein OSB04_007226 [Centaurea solstitialis]
MKRFSGGNPSIFFRNHMEEIEAKNEQIRCVTKFLTSWKQKATRDRDFLSLATRGWSALVSETARFATRNRCRRVFNPLFSLFQKNTTLILSRRREPSSRTCEIRASCASVPSFSMNKRQRTRSSTSTAPTFRAPDGSHAFTFFMNDPTLNASKREEYRDSVNRLLTRQVLVPRRVDWNLLRSMGVENDIKSILEKHAYDEDGTEYYICHAWERVFDIAETLYRELIIEFVATFRFDAKRPLRSSISHAWPFSVDLEKGICSCTFWQLAGIPCKRDPSTIVDGKGSRSIKCTKCQQKGHNQRKCANERVDPPIKVAKPQGRPKLNIGIPPTSRGGRGGRGRGGRGRGGKERGGMVGVSYQDGEALIHHLNGEVTPAWPPGVLPKVVQDEMDAQATRESDLRQGTIEEAGQYLEQEIDVDEIVAVDGYSMFYPLKKLLNSSLVACNDFAGYFLPTMGQKDTKSACREKITILGDGNKKVDDPRILNKTLFLDPRPMYYPLMKLFPFGKAKLVLETRWV